MKLTNKVMAKWVLLLLGMTMGTECLGSRRISMIDIQMKRIRSAIVVYRGTEGDFPASLDALAQRPYGLKKEDLIDPWGEAFGHDYSGDEYVVWSSGPDKKKGTADDIVIGSLQSYVNSWKAKNLPPVEAQGTNAVQAVTGETAQPTDGVGKVTPKRVPVTSTQSSAETDEPAETKTTPWKILLLIGGTVVGAMAAWCYFRKSGMQKGN